MTSAASKAIWGNGESKEEPVSGVQGDTSKGEPYDAGNMDPAKEAEADTNGKASSNPKTRDHETADHGASDNKDSEVGGKGESQSDAKDASSNEPSDKQGDVELNGPGPKPLETVAGEHGGDAGDTDGAKTESTDSADTKSGDNEDDDGVQKESHGEGTGEKYVKSSGVKADGGDFDAAAPGAGREADRLLEQKGFHREANTNTKSADGKDPLEEKINKPSLGQRIKNKLHTH